MAAAHYQPVGFTLHAIQRTAHGLCQFYALGIVLSIAKHLDTYRIGTAFALNRVLLQLGAAIHYIRQFRAVLHYRENLVSPCGYLSIGN